MLEQVPLPLVMPVSDDAKYKNEADQHKRNTERKIGGQVNVHLQRVLQEKLGVRTH